MIDGKKPHIHVWTRTIDGTEMGNGLYDHDVEASLAFLGVARQLTKYNLSVDITIEDVYNSLQNEGMGMYVGSPGLVAVISRCSGECISPTWN